MLTEQEFIDIVVDRIERHSERYFSFFMERTLKDVLLHWYRDMPSCTFSTDRKEITIKMGMEIISFPSNVFLVDGYNNFNMAEEFKGVY